MSQSPKTDVAARPRIVKISKTELAKLHRGMEKSKQEMLRRGRELAAKRRKGICENCGKHQATVQWIGDAGGVLAATHGWYQMWCQCCSLKAQLKFAKQQAERIPELEAALAKLSCKPVKLSRTNWKHSLGVTCYRPLSLDQIRYRNSI